MKFDELIAFTPTKVPHNFKDLSNTENDYFKIISRAPNINGRTAWNCQCKACGEYCVKETTNLNKHKSCGCARRENIGKALRKDLTGQRYGNLVAIEDTRRSNISGNAIWKCQCDCGSVCEVDSNNLISLHTTSCGCIKFSIGAKRISDILTLNNIPFIPEYRVSELGKYVDYPYRFDFAIIDDELNVVRLIEYDGIQHYMDTWGAWKTKQTLAEQQLRDHKKNAWAIKNNIPLVRIPYWERDKITLEMILGSTYEVREADQSVIE